MSTWIHLLQHTYIIDFKTYFMIPSSATQVWHFRPKLKKWHFPWQENYWNYELKIPQIIILIWKIKILKLYTFR